MTEVNPTSIPSPLPRAFARHALAYGAIGGALAAAGMIAVASLAPRDGGTDKTWIGGALALGLLVAAVVGGVMRWRDRVLGGEVRFVQAFGAGLAIGLVFGAVMALGAWIQTAVVDPGLLDRLADAAVRARSAEPANAGATAGEVARWQQDLRQQLTPGRYAYSAFASTLPMAFVIALMAAIVVRRRPAPAGPA